MAFSSSLNSTPIRCRGGHAVLPIRLCRRRATCAHGKRRKLCNTELDSSNHRFVVNATKELQESTDVEDEEFAFTVDTLSGVADKLLEGQDAPTAEQIAKGLNSSLRQGLSESNAKTNERKAAFGTNRLPSRKEVSLAELIWKAFDDSTIIILMVAGTLSLGLGVAIPSPGGNDWVEGAAILAAVAVVVGVSAGNDYQKERQFRELSSLSEESEVTVVRNGKQLEMSVFDLLVGDVLFVGYGDILPVDGILLEGSSSIRVDESALTGESESVVKSATSDSFLRSGSSILDGQGKILVTAVGRNSQQGQIFSSLTTPDSAMRDETALERKLDKLAGQIGAVGLAAGGFSLVAMAGQFTWQHFVVAREAWQWDFASTYLHYLITSVTIVVVAVPEGLPLSVTIALAYSVKRMLKDNNLVRRLSAAETMGCATTICTDKTGTLTKNEMTATKAWVAGKTIDVTEISSKEGGLDSLLDPKIVSTLNQAIALNCTAGLRRQASGEATPVGNGTECSLLGLAQRLGADFEEMEAGSEVVQRIPFSSERKRMTTLIRHTGSKTHGSDGDIIFSKGAAEIMLPLCTRVAQGDGSVTDLSRDQGQKILEGIQKGGERLITIAYRDHARSSRQQAARNGKEGKEAVEAEELESDLILLAIVGISDPLRPEVVDAVQQCNRAGITVRMLTGDNGLTASTIARQAGILNQTLGPDRPSPSDSHSQDNPDGSVIDGVDFRRRVLDAEGRVKQAEFDRLWEPLRVMARCSPTDKLTIVRGLQANPEECVCMTGDGTNDAPALKAADVGFAMNNGTSIAKEAADILLLDSNMNSIVKAVMWGRNVYAGITKFLQFQLVVNVVAVVTACTGAIASQESPITSVQMLWVNLIMDSLASLALATEVPREELLDSKPYSTQASLITPTVLKSIVGQCVFQLGVMYALVFHMPQVFGIPADQTALSGTVVFNTFVLMQLVNQINSRYINEEPNVLDGLLSNKLFVAIVSAELFLQILIVQFGGEVFSTTPLDPQQWAACWGIAVLGFPVRALLLQIPPKTSTAPHQEAAESSQA